MYWEKIVVPAWRWIKVGLTPILLFGGIGLAVCSLIAIAITSGTLAIMIITGKEWIAWITMFKAFGVEILILVIGLAMWLVGTGWAWQPY